MPKKTLRLLDKVLAFIGNVPASEVTALANMSHNERYLLFCLDTSSSMGNLKKLEFASEGLLDLARTALERRYRLGLVSFDTRTRSIVKDVNVIAPLKSAVSKLEAEGGTELTGALMLAFEELAPRPGHRCVCVITDGQTSNTASAIEAATKLHAKGIDVMAIGTEDADGEFLAKITTRGELLDIVSAPLDFTRALPRVGQQLLLGP